MAQPKAPAGFDDVHRILGKPMRAADKAAWPAKPHFGGPLPVLSTLSQLRVGLEIAHHARELATADQRREFDQVVKLAQRVSDGEKLTQKLLQEHSKASKSDPIAIKVARYAARMALGYLYASPSARNAICLNIENGGVAVVKHLANVERVRAFLRNVDDAILRVELAAALEERGLVATSPIARVVSRPRGTTKTLALVLAELADGRYGLYVKLKNRWEWHEGDRETMFATVPDDFMRAVAADIDPSFKNSRA